MLDLNAQGKEYPPYEFKVESSKIKELCLAIGDNNPIFFNKEEAKKQGFTDTPAPLTFGTVINFWGYTEIWDRMKEIGVDIQRLLHASEEYDYLKPIYPGDQISGQVKVESMRSSASMDVVTFKSTYKRGQEEVLIATMKIVVIIAEA